MRMFSALTKLSSSYSPLEAFLFDRLCDKATAPFHNFANDQLEPALEPNMRVLDVGCGGGRFAIRLAERHPEVEVVGLDLSPEQIARARRRGEALSERVSFVEASATAMPFAADEFDLVFSLGSLKHWPDRGLGLRECVRVLGPGGRLIVMEGDRGCRHEDVHRFVSTWNIPVKARPLAAAFYRLKVVGDSLDLDDARALLDEVPELDGRVERGEGLPMWTIFGSKRAAHGSGQRST
jgi:ubiquinone/menaquinone biosynthesis C-methylase UbiE